MQVTVVAHGLPAGEMAQLSSRLEPFKTRDSLACQEVDAIATRIVEQTGSRLGEAMAILVGILNSEHVIVGAPCASSRRQALPASATACAVVSAELGQDIGDIAAICIAL